MHTDIEKWLRVTREAGIKPQQPRRRRRMNSRFNFQTAKDNSVVGVIASEAIHLAAQRKEEWIASLRSQ
jgi:hypothetical protein